MLKAFFRFICWLILKMFFHEVDSFNESKVPSLGPLIFVCAPHANQFLDPIVITKNLKRKVLFLAAQKSLDRKYVGKMIRAMDSIGVKRPQDYMQKASGTITTAGSTVNGQDTKFLSEFAAASGIYISAKRDFFEIASIISDFELKLKAPLSTDVMQPCSIKVVPRIDQNEVFEHVWAELKRDGCIGIFPEGGSHDQTSILPLKAGVTIMALGAMASQPGLDVKIVPVGLNYFNGHRFRSLAYADFGDPISIPPELVEKYKDKATKREACAALLETIYESLQAVTVNAPDYSVMRLIQMVRRLYNPGAQLNADDKLKLHRRFALGYTKFKDDPRVQSLIKGVADYDFKLKHYHAKDSQVAHLSLGQL